MKLAFFLFLAVSGFAQLLDPTTLPVNEPKIPYNTTASSSTRDKERWTWGNWQYRERLRLAGANAALTTQNAILRDQIDNAPPALPVDLTPVLTKLNAIEAATKGNVTAIKLTVVAGQTVANFSWDYNGDTATGFRVERSTDGTNYTTLATLADPKARAYVDKGLTPGNYWWRVRAVVPVTVLPSGVTEPSNAPNAVIQ
jgi:hypothetical protein